MTFRKSLLLLACLTMIAALVACGSSKTITVTVSPATANVEVSTTLSTVTATTNDSKGVTWTAACGTVAPTSSLTGVAVVYTAPATVPNPATCVVTATSVSNTSVTGTATYTITPVPSVTITSTVPTVLYVNDTLNLVATTDDSSTVTWSCAPAGTCGAFNPATTASGATTVYTAPSSVPATTVVITATSATNATTSTNPITIDLSSGITVSLSTPPPSSMVAGATASIAATTNDTAGVTWSCTPVGACGSFNPTTTLTTVDTTYTAPSTATTVTITATSITDDVQYATSSPVTITAPVIAFGAGSYVFSMSGYDANDSFYAVSGVFTTADGATITAGEQDFTDYYYLKNDTAITGTITGPDAAGNYTITLNTGDDCIGPGASDTSGCTEGSGTGTGTETLVATLASSSKGLIAEYDTWATSNGTLDAQMATPGLPACSATATSAAPCGYAFVIGGVDTNGDPLAIGGILTEDGNGTISGTNSIFDANDSGNTTDGPLFPGETLGASTVAANDTLSLGRVEFMLVPTDTTDFGTSINLIGYVVDANHIRLVETSDDFVGTTGGTAFVQVNPGTFSSTSVSGNSYVVSLVGGDTVGGFLAAGLLTAGATTFSGWVNYNDLTLAADTVQAPDPVVEGTTTTPATYTVATNGDVSIPSMNDVSTTDYGANFNLQLYLDGNGNALAITMDTTDVTSGFAYQQPSADVGVFTAASFSGAYAMSTGGANAPTGDEYEYAAVGSISADGTSAISGAVDLNWLYGPTLTASLDVTGAFTVPSTTGANGIFTGTITGLDQDTPANVDNFAYYLVDPTRIVAIETDSNQLTIGYFLQ